MERYDFLEQREEDSFVDLYVKDSRASEVAADMQSKPVHERWYFEAFGTPEYARSGDLLDANSTYCVPFSGRSSYHQYTCNEETKTYEIYVNISMTDEEALNI